MLRSSKKQATGPRTFLARFNPLLFLLLLLYCISFFKWGPHRVTITIAQETGRHFDRLLAEYPLPTGLEYVFADPDAPGTVQFFAMEAAVNPASCSSRLSKITIRTWAARTRNILEQTPGNNKVLSLDEICLPETVWVPEPEGIHESADKSRLLSPLKNIFLSIDMAAPEQLLSWFAEIQEINEDPITWIYAVGDIMPDRSVDEILLSGPDGLSLVFGNTLPLLKNADFLIGNLEAAATAYDSRFQKSYQFKIKPEALGRLAESGFDYLMLSNNHTYDFNLQGFIDTLSNMKLHGLNFSGAGMNLKEAMTPYCTVVNNTRLNIISFGAYPSEVPLAQLKAAKDRPGVLWDDNGLEALQRMSSPDTFDIAVVHAGIEYADVPDASIRNLYQKCIDAGADLVLGSHPHVLQGLEVYREKLIAYSLGNFIFPGMEGWPNATDSMILQIGIYNGRIVAVKPVFTRLEGTRAMLANNQNLSARDRFYRLCADLSRR